MPFLIELSNLHYPARMHLSPLSELSDLHQDTDHHTHEYEPLHHVSP